MKLRGFNLVYFGACCAAALVLMTPGVRSSSAPTAEDDEADLALAQAITDLWGVKPIDASSRSKRAAVNSDAAVADRPVVPFIGTHERNREYNYWWINSDYRNQDNLLTYEKGLSTRTKVDLGGPYNFPVTLFDEHHHPQPVISTRRIGPYIYSTCRHRGEELFGRRCRRRLPAPGSNASPVNQPVEEVLDLSKEIGKTPSMQVLPIVPSTNHSLIAYATDSVGHNKYDIRVRSVETGEDVLPAPLANTNGEMAWSDDSKHLYYVTIGEGLSPDTVWRLNVDDPLSTPHPVYYEPDKKFRISLSRTLSNKLILITSTSPFESEIRYIKADHSFTDARLVVPRDTFMFYQLFERNGELIVLETDNYEATSALWWVTKEDVDMHGSEDSVWKYANMLASTRAETIDQVVVSSRQIVALVTRRGEGHLNVWKYPSREPISAKLPDEVKLYDAGAPWKRISFPTDFNMPVLRVESSSAQAHYLVQEVNMATYTRTIIDAGHADIPTGDKDSVQHLYTQLSDSCGGGRVSYVLRKDLFQRNGRAPLVLFAVDSDSGPLSLMEQAQYNVLLDMGFVIGRMTVHPRGFVTNSTCTAEGPKVQMRSTMELVAAVKQLVARKVTSHDRVIVVAARRATTAALDAINWYTRLVAGVVVTQPITDLVYEMSDTRPIDLKVPYGPHSRSLAVQEYDSVLLNSPIDGMQKKPYPPMLLLADATDTEIGNWQATKYMALLRTMEAVPKLKWLYTRAADDVQEPFERRKVVQKDQIQFMLHALGLRRTPSTMVASNMYARPIGAPYTT